MNITAYTYDADIHCPSCTMQANLHSNNEHTNALSLGRSDALNCDENGLSYNLEDHAGSLIHPVFSTDETNFTHCSDCSQEL